MLGAYELLLFPHLEVFHGEEQRLACVVVAKTLRKPEQCEPWERTRMWAPIGQRAEE